MTKSAHEKGFTLVELAISLVVIGLLIGGVLKGRELVENARISASIRMINEYNSAAMVFRTTYGVFPGDMPDPQQRLKNCNQQVCSRGGNRDDYITSQDMPTDIFGMNAGGNPAAMFEIYNFFVHIGRADLADAPSGGTMAEMADYNNPKSNELFFPELPTKRGNRAFVRLYYIGTGSAAPPTGVTEQLPRHYFQLMTNGLTAAVIDQKMDDGMPFTGDVRDHGHNVFPRNHRCVDNLQPRNNLTKYDINTMRCVLNIASGF